MLAGMWTIAAEGNRNPETVAPRLRDVNRPVIETLRDDPVFQTGGTNQNPFMRNLHNTLVLGPLGLLSDSSASIFGLVSEPLA